LLGFLGVENNLTIRGLNRRCSLIESHSLVSLGRDTMRGKPFTSITSKKKDDVIKKFGQAKIF
jgi:hypothetical protein